MLRRLHGSAAKAIYLLETERAKERGRERVHKLLMMAVGRLFLALICICQTSSRAYSSSSTTAGYPRAAEQAAGVKIEVTKFFFPFPIFLPP